MATFNGERFLEEQLHSIECQTFQDWDIWISDDGSKDSTLEIVHKFSEKHPNKVHLLPEHAPTGSACANFFHLMREVPKTYEYYAFCDQDDFWHKNKLEKEVSEIKSINAKSVPALVFCDARVVDAQRNVMGESFFSYTGVNPKNVALCQLIVQNPISGAATIVNDPLITLACKATSIQNIDMHDQWVGLIAATLGKISCVNEALFDYRQHAGNQVGARKMSLSAVFNKFKIGKSSLDTKEKQVGRLLKEYSDQLCPNHRNLCETFYNINDVSKVERINWIRRNKVEMNGFLRNIGLKMFI